MVDMTTFIASDHPRGQAANPGQFREKTNDAPSGELTATDETLPICPTHGGEWGGDITCGTCVDDVTGEMREFDLSEDGEASVKPLCARCDDYATDPDGLCDRHTLRWGTLDIHSGSRTPWGPAQTVNEVAPGIAVASCAGHGGVKLSPERNREIPAALRNSSGWYEEDCEYNIPARYFAAEFAAQPHLRDRYTAETMREDADRSIRDWFPDKWEKANGRQLVKGESSTRDEQLWAAEHAHEFVVSYARPSVTDPGMVRVGAKRLSDGADEVFLVPVEEYEARRQQKMVGPDDRPWRSETSGMRYREKPDDGFGPYVRDPRPEKVHPSDIGRNGRFVIDPTRHAQLPPAPPKPKPSPNQTYTVALPDIYEFQKSSLTPAARERVWGELGKRWKLHDGRTLTLREMVTEDGVEGITAMSDNGRMKNRVSLVGGSIPISKATFDYLESMGVKDTRAQSQRASQAYSVAREKYENFTDGGDHTFWRDAKAKARAEKLSAEAERLYREMVAAHAQERAERDAHEGTAAERAAAEEALIAERERNARVFGGRA